MYINLFLLSVYTLGRRRNGSGKKFLLAASCVIAVVATTQMALVITQTILTARSVQQLLHAQVIGHPRLVKTLQTAQVSLGFINKWVYPGSSGPDLTRPASLVTDSLFVEFFRLKGYELTI